MIKIMMSGKVRFFLHAQALLIKWDGCSRIMASASLVRTSDDENKIDDNLRVGAPNHFVLLFLGLLR